jgi:hypothetical protein
MENNNKTIGQVLADNLVGRKIRVFRRKNSSYTEGDIMTPKYHYETNYYSIENGTVDSAICEIMEVHTKNILDYRIVLVIADDGISGVIRNLKLNAELNFINE